MEKYFCSSRSLMSSNSNFRLVRFFMLHRIVRFSSCTGHDRQQLNSVFTWYHHINDWYFIDLVPNFYCATLTNNLIGECVVQLAKMNIGSVRKESKNLVRILSYKLVTCHFQIAIIWDVCSQRQAEVSCCLLYVVSWYSDLRK